MKWRKRNFNGKKIIWVSYLILDIHLFKTSQLEILRHLAKYGYETTLIATHSRKPLQIRDLQINIISIPLRYKTIFSSIAFSLIILFFLPFYIIMSSPDFIIIEPNIAFISLFPTIILSRFKKFKLVLDIRSTPVEIGGFLDIFINIRFSTSVLVSKRLFDGITIITNLMKKELCKKFKLNPNRVGVWSSGVSISHFDSDLFELDRIILRKKFRLSTKFVVFYHGSFGPNRGLIETVTSISIVKNVYPDIVLFLIGEGILRDKFEKMVQIFGLQNNIVIHDTVDYLEIPKYITLCDIGIVPLPDIPDRRFQCPLKLLEYLAMKKPVIVTDIPANRLVFGKSKCCIPISSVEPTTIAKSIIFAYKNKKNLKEWGASGRMIINAKYTWEKVAKELENYISRI